jgi:hypothetical protein
MRRLPVHPRVPQILKIDEPKASVIPMIKHRTLVCGHVTRREVNEWSKGGTIGREVKVSQFRIIYITGNFNLFLLPTIPGAVNNRRYALLAYLGGLLSLRWFRLQ